MAIHCLSGITPDPLPEQAAADPRLDEAAIERVGGVVLVGVLHDHPASTYRARTVVGAMDPDVLALELPPLAVPLAAHHAADERTPPALGGEMSAAVQAADTDRVVGIDGPSVGFLRYLAAELFAERAAPATVRRTAAALRSVTSRAVARRVTAAVAALTAEVLDPEHGRLRVAIAAAGSVREVFAAVLATGGTVRRLTERRPTLEDVFFQAIDGFSAAPVAGGSR